MRELLSKQQSWVLTKGISAGNSTPFRIPVLSPPGQMAQTHIFLVCLLAMIARRVLVLACLVLAVAPLQSASGQEAGVAEAEKIDLDEVLDSLADAGAAEASDVSVSVYLAVLLDTYDPASARRMGARGGGWPGGTWSVPVVSRSFISWQLSCRKSSCNMQAR